MLRWHILFAVSILGFFGISCTSPRNLVSQDQTVPLIQDAVAPVAEFPGPMDSPQQSTDVGVREVEAERMQKVLTTSTVQFVEDSVFDCDDDVLTLLSGSKWRLSIPESFLPSSDVLIVLTDNHQATAYSEGQSALVRYMSGSLPTSMGTIHTVIQSLSEGALLKLDDGSLWEVPDYDQYDTGFWLPPYDVILTEDEMYMINIEEGTKIWVSKADD